MKQVPLVVIVGRMNVGKSTLFNRLSYGVKSIALDYEGVTRDIIKNIVTWHDRSFMLVDTGGITMRKTDDPIQQQVQQRAREILSRADVVLLVCDGTVGIMPEDREIAKMLHKLGKQAILVINKIDTRVAQEQVHEFVTLGHEPEIAVSAQHGAGISDLFDAIEHQLAASFGKAQEVAKPDSPFEDQDEDQESDTEKRGYKVVLLGKPNVGKSSLMNLLLQEERSIVSAEPGTTREAISEKITFYQEDIQITDTAGVRRMRSVTEPLEQLMVRSTLRAVEYADIVLLLIDASEGKISDQEMKLAFYAFEQKHKAVILLFNKQDLVDEYEAQTMEQHLGEYVFLVKKLAQLPISCKEQKNIGKVIPLVHKVWEKYTAHFDQHSLTVLFKEAITHKPLYHKKNALAVYSAEQVSTGPITIVLRVNEPLWFGESQLAFFENILRKKYDLQGVPVKLLTRKR